MQELETTVAMLQLRKQLTGCAIRPQFICMLCQQTLDSRFCHVIHFLLGLLYIQVGLWQGSLWRQVQLHMSWFQGMVTTQRCVHLVAQWWFLLVTQSSRKEIQSGIGAFFSRSPWAMTCSSLQLVVLWSFHVLLRWFFHSGMSIWISTGKCLRFHGSLRVQLEAEWTLQCETQTSQRLQFLA